MAVLPTLNGREIVRYKTILFVNVFSMPSGHH